LAVRKVLPFVALVILAGCGGSSPFSASERDEINKRITETNDAWEEFIAAGDACTGADAGDCFKAALDSSGFPTAVGNLRSTVVKFRDKVEGGDCQSALDDLEFGLRIVGANLDALKYGDADNADAMQTTASSLREAWDSAAGSRDRAADACS
jgi:hypothetical protein